MVDSRPVRVITQDTENNILVTGFMGGMKNAIIELMVYTDTLNPDDAFQIDPPDPTRIFIQRKMSARIILDPIMAGQLADWLKGQIALYEDIFGKIKIPQGAPRNPPSELLEMKREENITVDQKQLEKDIEKSIRASRGQEQPKSKSS